MSHATDPSAAPAAPPPQPVALLPEAAISRETVTSQLRYAFRMTRNRGGLWVPVELGQGKFARVLCGQQQIGNQPARSVAVKILHSHAKLTDERLFANEIAHLRKLSDADNVNVLHILDVLQLRPLVLCGCGKIYHPRCPACGQESLTRIEAEALPALHCVACGYVLPANRVMDRAQELSSQAARSCCQDRSVEGRGTIINFVHRDAIVMEHLTLGLKDFARVRREEVLEQWRKKEGESKAMVLASKRSWTARVAAWLPGEWRRRRSAELVEKALLLEKVLVVVQLVEAVAWLHGEKRIIHKDLAADNIMVRLSGIRHGKSNWRGEHRPEMSVHDILNDITSYPTFRTLLIDFGLADEVVPTRSWYDDAEAAGQNKSPFLSPEAKNRRQDVSLDQPIAFSPDEQTFVIPPEMRGLSLPLMAGDLVSHSLDEDHAHDLKIENVLDHGKLAKYGGIAPGVQDYRRCVVERPLLEPHDIFALGALFYFLLCEDATRLDPLHALVYTAQEKHRTVDVASLRGLDLYPGVRKAIRSAFWQDEMIVIILRAMTRGLPGSYARTRIHRGGEPAQRFLLEIKRLHHDIQRDIVSTFWR